MLIMRWDVEWWGEVSWFSFFSFSFFPWFPVGVGTAVIAYDRAVIFFFTHPSLWLLIGGWESESKIGVMAMGNLFSLNDGFVIMILLVK